MQKNLACLIIAKDEADRIGNALMSVKWINEIVVVVDDKTTDKTEEVARQYTRLIFRREWDGFVGMKEFGLSKISAAWVLWLDADEVVTPRLAESIQNLPEEPSFYAYQINIKSQFMGRWMRCWSRPQDKHIRLFLADKVNFDETLVHEKLGAVELADSKVGKLKGEIEHFPVRNLFHLAEKINLYSTLTAKQMQKKGIKFHYWQLFYYPTINFFKAFLWRDGWRDGWRGLILNVFYAYNTFLDYLKLWEIQENPKFKNQNLNPKLKA